MLVILATYNDIIKVGNWEHFCKDTGLNEYCIAKGADPSTIIELTIEQAESYDLIKLKKEG